MSRGRGTRRQGRELALKIIYWLKSSEDDLQAVLSDFWNNFRFRNDALGEPADDAPVNEDARLFAEKLVRGVHQHLDEIDGMISRCSSNWSLDRMARVDLSLLRLGAFELKHCPDVPTSVVINEAVEIGKRYGTAETAPFVNGILDRIAREERNGSA
ncbi:MAG: transcription antitermination factor NusB [Deltaproteobacteria bacterium]|nr:MAG: transcription antitermination factor NusB [Deltaproteobacteria bacterium]